MPYRQAVAIAERGDADLIDDVLDQLAGFLSGAPQRVDWSVLAGRLVANMPDEDEMASRSCQVLDDALASAAYAVRSAIAFDPAEAANAASRLCDAVDAHAQHLLGVVAFTAQVDRQLLEHAVVQQELDRQQRDLEELASGGVTPSDVLDRARAEAALDLKESA